MWIYLKIYAKWNRSIVWIDHLINHTYIVTRQLYKIVLGSHANCKLFKKYIDNWLIHSQSHEEMKQLVAQSLDDPTSCLVFLFFS